MSQRDELQQEDGTNQIALKRLTSFAGCESEAGIELRSVAELCSTSS
jgi:hypothetical protein